MQICDVNKGISCYSFYSAGLIQLIITIYFSLLCLKALKLYYLTASKYPRMTRIHFIKEFTLFMIIIIEIAGIFIGLDPKYDDDDIDGSELFNFIINIFSEIICMILLRKEFSTLKYTSGYLRSYILLSFFIFTIVILINAFNSKSTQFGLTSIQIDYVISIIVKFILTIQVFIHKSDLIRKKSNSNEDDNNLDDFQITQENDDFDGKNNDNNNDDLYFNLQDHHNQHYNFEIINNQISQNPIESEIQQIDYHDQNEQEQNQIVYYSKHQYYSISENNQQNVNSSNIQNSNNNRLGIHNGLQQQQQQHSENDQNKINKNHNYFRNSNQTSENSYTSSQNNKGNSNKRSSLTSGLIPQSKIGLNSTISQNTMNMNEKMQLSNHQYQINHIYVLDIYNSNDNIIIKIELKLVSGQSYQFNRTLSEFQQIVYFIRHYLKHDDIELLEIEETNTNLRFNDKQEQESFLRKLEKAMNLIIINNFHMNVNIKDFFKSDTTSSQLNLNQYYNSEKGVSREDEYDYIEEQKNSIHQNILQQNNNKNDQKTDLDDLFTDNNQSQISNQVSICIDSLSNSINDEINSSTIKPKDNLEDIIIKVSQINTEFIPGEDYTKYFIKLQYYSKAGIKEYTIETRYKEILQAHNNIKEALPRIEIPELPFKEKTMDIFKSKTDQDIIDFRKKTLPHYFETILNNKSIQKIPFIKATFFL